MLEEGSLHRNRHRAIDADRALGIDCGVKSAAVEGVSTLNTALSV